MGEEIQIDAMRASDWPAVSEIYQQGIATGHATFALQPPGSWQQWCNDVNPDCSLVARGESEVLGWAAASPVAERCVFAGVAEVAVYVSSARHGQGLGSRLLSALIERSESLRIWTLQAGIFPENSSSIMLHRKHSFRVVGIREKLGRMDYGPERGNWRDVMLLERRSLVVGFD